MCQLNAKSTTIDDRNSSCEEDERIIRLAMKLLGHAGSRSKIALIKNHVAANHLDAALL